MKITLPQDARALSQQPLPDWLELAYVEDYPPKLRDKHYRNSSKTSEWEVGVLYAEEWTSTQITEYVVSTISRFTKVLRCDYWGDDTITITIRGSTLPEYIPYLECTLIRDVLKESEQLDREIEAYQMMEPTALLDADLDEYVSKDPRKASIAVSTPTFPPNLIKPRSSVYFIASIGGTPIYFDLLLSHSFSTMIEVAWSKFTSSVAFVVLSFMRPGDVIEENRFQFVMNRKDGSIKLFDGKKIGDSLNSPFAVEEPTVKVAVPDLYRKLVKMVDVKFG